jgi:bifunctional non-homologous end joining protein LigD
MLWDNGTYEADVDDVGKALRAGELRFRLDGKKLHGAWVLVRTGGRKWLLFKRTDAAASKTADITTEKPRSVTTRRLLAGIARDGGGDVAKAATGDP